MLTLLGWYQSTGALGNVPQPGALAAGAAGHSLSLHQHNEGVKLLLMNHTEDEGIVNNCLLLNP